LQLHDNMLQEYLPWTRTSHAASSAETMTMSARPWSAAWRTRGEASSSAAVASSSCTGRSDGAKGLRVESVASVRHRSACSRVAARLGGVLGNGNDGHKRNKVRTGH
jgi:hypothetical protein